MGEKLKKEKFVSEALEEDRTAHSEKKIDRQWQSTQRAIGQPQQLSWVRFNSPRTLIRSRLHTKITTTHKSSKSSTAAGCGNCDVLQATTELDRVQNFDNL